MASKPSVTPNAGVFSLLFLMCVGVLGYCVYLTQTNQYLDVQASALSPSWLFFKPAFVREIIVDGGFVGTLCAVLLKMFNTLVYAGVGFGVFYYAFHSLSETKSSPQLKKAEQRPLVNGEVTAEIPGSELLVILPTYRNLTLGTTSGGTTDRNPYRQVFYRIGTNPPTLAEGTVMNAYRTLYVAIYAMLDAHPEVPASIGTHHADASLRDHSIAVSKMVVARYRELGKLEPLAAIAGLAHDLDKLLGYQFKGGKWVKNANATHHSKYSAYITSTQPEFRQLPKEDQSVLVLALRYYHDPQNLPLGAHSRTETLIGVLRLCDGLTTQQEKTTGVQTAVMDADGLELIDNALIHTLKELNVNSYMEGVPHAGGWTMPALDYVLIPISTVLEHIGRHMSPELNRKLQLDHETRTFNHPAADLIRERLEHMSLLMKSYKNLVSDTGMYDCRIGVTRFMAVLMLEKTKLDSFLPGMLEKWGKAKYGIRITGATADKSKQPDNDLSSDD